MKFGYKKLTSFVMHHFFHIKHVIESTMTAVTNQEFLYIYL